MFQSKIQNQGLGNDHLGMQGLCCQIKGWKEIPSSPHRHCAYHTMFQSKIQNQGLGNDHLGMQGLCCQLQIWK